MDRLTDPDTLDRLRGCVSRLARSNAATVSNPRALSGGAIQENWAFDVDFLDGPLRGTQTLVLRADAASSIPFSHSRDIEFAILRRAFQGGVPVPEPLWYVEDAGVIGRPFMIMRRVNGTANAHQLVKAAVPGDAADLLVAQIGAILARTHGLPVQANGHETNAVDRRLSEFRTFLDLHDVIDPVFEWAMQWLNVMRPKTNETVFCHHDFRTGNIMIEEGRVVAVLDWEFAGVGDRHEDLGWFCAKCWRFGAVDREAGGLGSREAFLQGYEAQAKTTVDRTAVLYWEVMATFRWAVIAMAQVDRFISGRQRSLELGLTAHIIPRLQADLLEMTGPERWS